MQTHQDRAPLALRTVLCIFLPFAAGYFLSYLFRTVNAVIAGDLQADLGLSAGELGLLTSMYFLAFAGFQLPLGVLLDRYGPRRVEAALLLLAGFGALVFALGQGVASLSVGRALIGLGVSACLMASLKAFVLWFPARSLPLVNGWLLAFGGLGAVVATRPTELALDGIGWRGVFGIVAAACLLTALAIWWLVPEHGDQKRAGATPLAEQVAALRRIFGHHLFWRVAPIAALTQGGSFAMYGLWAGPWLRDVAGQQRGEAANILMVIAIAMTVGFAVLGSLGTWLRRFGVTLWQVAAVGLLLFMLSSLGLVLQIEWLATPAWLLYGFSSTAGTLFFALLSQHFNPDLAGRVNTALNLLIFSSAFLLQWGLGIVIQSWEFADGSGYAAAGYMWAFGGVWLAQLLALIWFFLPVRRS